MTAEIEQLQVKYIPLDDARAWEANPKLHDLGQLAASIARHGFKNPPRYEPALNEGRGGVVAGNGRIEALTWMRAQGQEPPRGIAVVDGAWHVPVLFGVDAASEAAAEAYGLDDNSSVLAGSDFTALDAARLWTDDYVAMLQRLAEQGELPITVDGDDLDTLLRTLGPMQLDMGHIPPQSASGVLGNGVTPGMVPLGQGPDLPEGLAPSYIRMVQLFFTTDTQPEFLRMASALQVHFERTNLTDTLMEVVRYAYRTLDLQDAE